MAAAVTAAVYSSSSTASSKRGKNKGSVALSCSSDSDSSSSVEVVASAGQLLQTQLPAQFLAGKRKKRPASGSSDEAFMQPKKKAKKQDTKRTAPSTKR